MPPDERLSKVTRLLLAVATTALAVAATALWIRNFSWGRGSAHTR